MRGVVSVSAQGILFDMDGVLVSSIGSAERSWRIWAARHGIANAETLEVPHGRRAIDIVRLLRPDIDAQAGLKVIEDLEVEDTADVRALPGARRLLESLPLTRWAIVTSATRRLLLARLNAAGLPVPDRIISGEMVERGKPDPEPYRKGAELLGFSPADCIVVEDAPAGVGSGRAAGCRVMAVLGTESVEDLRGANWVVRSLEEVGATVKADGVKLEFDAL